MARNINPKDAIDDNTAHNRLFKAYLLINEQYVEKFNRQRVVEQGLMALGMQHIYRAVNESALSFDAFLGLNRKKRKVPEVFSSFGKLLFEERKSKDY
jgi:hypothetical protein